MSLLNRKRTILAKIESSYGVDASPTGGANAIQCRNLDIMPMEGGTVSRDLVRTFFGNSEQLPTAVYTKASMEVEIAGSGAAGTAPAWGPLLRACGFAETILGTAHSGTAQAGAANTITLANTASASNDAYLGMKIVTNGGTGSGQTRTIIDYVGSTKVATLDRAWTVTPDATTTYTVAACVAYAPISNSPESVSVYFNVDGVLHKLLGSRGAVNIAMNAEQIPVFKFEFSGIYVAVADGAAPTVTLTAWKQPLVVNRVNTPEVSLHGISAVMDSMSINLANDVQFRSLPGGAEQVLLVDRKPSGDISIEATTVATKDWWSVVRNATLASAVVEHGIAAGNIVRITTPAAQLINPKYGDSQGVAMLQFGTTVLPVSGNDELLICAL